MMSWRLAGTAARLSSARASVSLPHGEVRIVPILHEGASMIVSTKRVPNFLEQLVAEWYEYRGYFVRRNVLVGRRSQGGQDGELDIVAFNPP